MKISVSSPKQRVGGFTLIELLVVIAIISILAAILFPSVPRLWPGARKRAPFELLQQP